MLFGGELLFGLAWDDAQFSEVTYVPISSPFLLHIPRLFCSFLVRAHFTLYIQLYQAN